MHSSGLFLVFASAACFLTAMASATEFEPSLEFNQAEELVFSSWNHFAGFKATQQAMKTMLAELSAVPVESRTEIVNDYIKNLSELLSFSEFDAAKCSSIKNQIVKAQDKYAQFRANLGPYLMAARLRQMAYCADPRPENKGGSPDYTTVANVDDQVMAYVDARDTDAKCGAQCLGEELGLPALRMGETPQMKQVLSSTSFKHALRMVYEIDDEPVYRLYYPRAIRQLLKELADAEKRDGKLDEPLKILRDELASLLDVCTPEPSKCGTVFERFSQVFPMDYEQLSYRANLRQYAKECLLSMNRFCSYFD